MSNTNQEILDKIRFFFKDIKWKKILIFSFFLILSSTLWLMQIYRQKYEATLVVPIKYINVPDSILFQTTLDNEIKIRIKDDGGTLFRYFFTRGHDSLIVDMKEFINKNSSHVIQGSELDMMVRSKIFLSSELIGYSPTQLLYAYEALESKRLSVIYDGYIKLLPGYIIDGDLSVEPESVMAYGSQDILDTLSFAYTTSDTLTNIKVDKVVSLHILPVEGIKFVPDKIDLAIPIDEYATKTLDVPIVCDNLPRDLDIKLFPSTVKVSFIVGLKRYKDINADDFEVKINYDDIVSSDKPIVAVRIVTSPDYIKTKPPVPAEVEYILEQK